MRTAIFCCGMLIENSISKGVNYASENSIEFLAIIFIIFIIMDIAEFVHKLSK